MPPRARIRGRGGIVRFDPALHPRNRVGMFRDVLGRLDIGQTVRLPDGTTVKRTRRAGGGRFEVTSPGAGTRHEVATPEAAAQDALGAVEPRPAAVEVRPQRITGEPVRMTGRQARLHDARAEAAARNARMFGTDPSWYGMPSPAQGGVEDIGPGDRVTIRTPQGQERTGRAVMRGPAGWVLNMGGRHGTPGIASDSNIVRVRKARTPGPTIPGGPASPAQDISRRARERFDWPWEADQARLAYPGLAARMTDEDLDAALRGLGEEGDDAGEPPWARELYALARGALRDEQARRAGAAAPSQGEFAAMLGGGGAERMALGGGPPRGAPTPEATGSIPFEPVGTWEDRAADMGEINRLVHGMAPGTEISLPSGVRLRRASQTGWEALHLIDPQGDTRTTYPAGMTMPAIMGTLAMHYDLPGAPQRPRGAAAPAQGGWDVPVRVTNYLVPDRPTTVPVTVVGGRREEPLLDVLERLDHGGSRELAQRVRAGETPDPAEIARVANALHGEATYRAYSDMGLVLDYGAAADALERLAGPPGASSPAQGDYYDWEEGATLADFGEGEGEFEQGLQAVLGGVRYATDEPGVMGDYLRTESFGEGGVLTYNSGVTVDFPAGKSERDVEVVVQDVLGDVEQVTSVRTYDEAGVLGGGHGLVVRMENGDEYQLSIVDSSDRPAGRDGEFQITIVQSGAGAMSPAQGGTPQQLARSRGTGALNLADPDAPRTWVRTSDGRQGWLVDFKDGRWEVQFADPLPSDLPDGSEKYEDDELTVIQGPESPAQRKEPSGAETSPQGRMADLARADAESRLGAPRHPRSRAYMGAYVRALSDDSLRSEYGRALDFGPQTRLNAIVAEMRRRGMEV